MGGFFILTNGACNFSGAVPEIRTGASLQFEFRGTPSPTAACGPPSFNLGKWTACGRNNVSRTVGVLDWIDGGAVSATEWRKVNVPVAKLLDNAGLQPCGADAWNLDRWVERGAGARGSRGVAGRGGAGRWGRGLSGAGGGGSRRPTCFLLPPP
jgi:hypothetical protein